MESEKVVALRGAVVPNYANIVVSNTRVRSAKVQVFVRIQMYPQSVNSVEDLDIVNIANGRLSA
jgi:uncharacterized Fe-S radical SAM superfamily protein PflX